MPPLFTPDIPNLEERIFHNSSNRFGLDYRAAAETFPKMPWPIIDVHTHINGHQACLVYAQAADAYGIGSLYSMTRLEDVDLLQDQLGDRNPFSSQYQTSGIPDSQAGIWG